MASIKLIQHIFLFKIVQSKFPPILSNLKHEMKTNGKYKLKSCSSKKTSSGFSLSPFCEKLFSFIYHEIAYSDSAHLITIAWKTRNR